MKDRCAENYIPGSSLSGRRLIDFLVFEDPKLLYSTSTETTTWCGSKGGSGRRSAPLKLKRSAPYTPGF